MTVPNENTQSPPSPVHGLVAFGRMIKFSHSIFALPFALAAAAIAARTTTIHVTVVLGIVVAMVAARTAAMGWNRIIDRHIDAKNPRTETREIPSGKISLKVAWAATLLSIALFVGAAAYLGPLCLKLSPLALFFLLGYSYTKRFTWLCHVFLGVAIAGGPAGAWIAVTSSFGATPGWLMLAVTTWIGGFDILYALSDMEYDRKAKLHSIPARFGIRTSLILSGLLHAVAFAALVMTGVAGDMGIYYLAGVGLIGGILIWEHSIVRPGDLSRLNMAFFTLNGYVSIAFLAATLLDIGLGSS
jgi:4-hydroxybenzoate polyprenyltransferase